jgi:hypothetical protein
MENTQCIWAKSEIRVRQSFPDERGRVQGKKERKETKGEKLNQ